MQHAELICPHLPASQQDPSGWFSDSEEADPHSLSGTVRRSTVLPAAGHYGGSACIFLRADHKCALQVAGESAGFHPWRFKPFYCILHPLDFDETGQITLDESNALAQEPASCLRAADQSTPLLLTFEPELRYLLGDKEYQKLLKSLQPQS